MTTSRPPRLLDQVRSTIRLRGYTPATERSYVSWIRRYILYHGKQHPARLGPRHVADFLSHLANERGVAAATQNLSLNAIVFLYEQVLERHAGDFGAFERARGPRRLPVVLSRTEVRALLEHMQGSPALVAALLYGSGLRLGEAISLRVQDLDFELRQILVRRGKGKRDRRTMLPEPLLGTLTTHLARVRETFEADLRNGTGAVPLPDALDRKYPSAAREWRWQYLFPSRMVTSHQVCKN